MHSQRKLHSNKTFSGLIVTAFLLVAGCSGPEVASGTHDPFENTNRGTHEFNKDVDTVVLRPVSQAYGTVVPAPIREGASNFSRNLSLPGMVVNDLLQFRIDDAIVNSGRFVTNSTIGLAGVLDPASILGIYARDTDFGETLHVWGAREGAYVELPLLGPSTGRDTVGKVVDFALNPTRVILPQDVQDIATGAAVADVANTRYRFSNTIDSVLYDSADSYAQARLLYLQNRRFQLGQGTSQEAEYDDIYEDPYDQ